jgi:hypothetical protein
MRNLQTILESLREGIGADLARFVGGDLNSDFDSDDANAGITGEDIFAILARAKTGQTEALPARAE